MADKRLQQCGCTAMPLPPKSIHQTTIDIRIDFCPLHAAAPELLSALSNTKRCLERPDRSQLSVRNAVKKADEAIKKAGGE